MKTLVIQSAKSPSSPGWIKVCLESVAQWSQQNDFHYQFVDDAIFDLVPDWYMAKVVNKLPVATDYARLVLLQKALDDGYEQAIWFDADTLIFDQSLTLDFDGSCAFGQEVWVQEHEGKLVARKNVHNAVCVFRKDCPVLPFLSYTVKSIMRRVNPEKISPQLVGPKLLGALNNIAGFTLLPQVGALSPLVAQDIVTDQFQALNLLREKSTAPIQALNLCASLIENKQALDVTDYLLARQSL